MSKLLDDIEAKAKLATPGPWRLGAQNDCLIVKPSVPFVTPIARADSWLADKDAAYIAAVNPAVALKICAALRAAEAALALLDGNGLVNTEVSVHQWQAKAVPAKQALAALDEEA